MIPDETYALAMNEPDSPVLMPGSQLRRLEGCEIWLGPSTLPNLTVVRKVRTSSQDLQALLSHVREVVTAIGRTSARWWITPLSTPSILVEALTNEGLESDGESIAAMVAPTSALLEVPSQIEVRPAETLDDYILCGKIAAVAFGTEPADSSATSSVFDAERSEGAVAAYMAFIDGRAVATGRATFAAHGVVLNGGATLPEARGRGAYRALVAARAREAKRRGIEWVVVQARPSAAPILLRLGFESVGEIRVLVDNW